MQFCLQSCMLRPYERGVKKANNLFGWRSRNRLKSIHSFAWQFYACIRFNSNFIRFGLYIFAFFMNK